MRNISKAEIGGRTKKGNESKMALRFLAGETKEMLVH